MTHRAYENFEGAQCSDPEYVALEFQSISDHFTELETRVAKLEQILAYHQRMSKHDTNN